MRLKVKVAAAPTQRLQEALTKSIAERRRRVVRGPLSSMRLNIPVPSIAAVLSRNEVQPVAGPSTILDVPTPARLLGKRSAVVSLRKRARSSRVVVLPSMRHLLQGEGETLLTAVSSLQGSCTLRERSAIAQTTAREGTAGVVSSGAILRSTRGSLSRMTL
jgi:hypothetical protein